LTTGSLVVHKAGEFAAFCSETVDSLFGELVLKLGTENPQPKFGLKELRICLVVHSTPEKI